MPDLSRQVVKANSSAEKKARWSHLHLHPLKQSFRRNTAVLYTTSSTQLEQQQEEKGGEAVSITPALDCRTAATKANIECPPAFPGKLHLSTSLG